MIRIDGLYGQSRRLRMFLLPCFAVFVAVDIWLFKFNLDATVCRFFLHSLSFSPYGVSAYQNFTRSQPLQLQLRGSRRVHIHLFRPKDGCIGYRLSRLRVYSVHWLLSECIGLSYTNCRPGVADRRLCISFFVIRSRSTSCAYYSKHKFIFIRLPF